MKKYFLVVFCGALLFLLAGCSSKNQVVCTVEETEGGITMKGEVLVDFDKNDKLTDATATYDVGDKKTADQYCSFLKLMEDKEKGIEVSCSGTKITIKGFAKIDDEDEKMVGMSKEDFLKKAKEENMSCK